MIGGGDTGSDCVGTAIRQGARTVTQLQYHDRPPDHAEVRDHWPEQVPEWHANDHDAEGCRHIWGHDTIAFKGEDCVTGMVLQQLRWKRRADGGWDRQLLPGKVRQLPAQLVLIATGYAHPLHRGLVESLGLQLDGHGCVAAADTDYQASIPGVFSCGDMRRGQSLVVRAIREGRQCARAVDRWLSGNSELPRV